MPPRVLADLSATTAFAARIAGMVKRGDAILLDGPLGAGKTAFARAFLRSASGMADLEVPSPTFTLVQSYDTPRGPVHHFDLWRLAPPDGAGLHALDELGWDDMRNDIVLVEWPDRLGSRRPADALTITLAPAGAESRTATLCGWPDRAVALA